MRRHGGDPERSLAALNVEQSTRKSLARAGGPDIEKTLTRVSGAVERRRGRPGKTASYSFGAATSDGQRFRILRPHAQGGLGIVFVAFDTELNRQVALKQILDSHADDPTSRSRFLLEAEVTGGLEHPGIVPVYGLGSYGDGRPYYAMRFIEGDSLKQAIDRFHKDAQLQSDSGQRSLELRGLLGPSLMYATPFNMPTVVASSIATSNRATSSSAATVRPSWSTEAWPSLPVKPNCILAPPPARSSGRRPAEAQTHCRAAPGHARFYEPRASTGPARPSWPAQRRL